MQRGAVRRAGISGVGARKNRNVRGAQLFHRRLGGRVAHGRQARAARKALLEHRAAPAA